MDPVPTSSFSQRHGYRMPDVEITIREDAPQVVRDAVLRIGYAFDVGPGRMRELLCDLLLRRPDSNNWSPGNIEAEVISLADSAPWFRIYDLAERLHEEIKGRDFTNTMSSAFAARINEAFRELGVGWVMEGGEFVARGSRAFEASRTGAVEVMEQAGLLTAAEEMREALADISRRPTADITGAVQHGMASLECVARDVYATTETLGPIISKMDIPRPLDQALHKMWGFASEQGRHIIEGRRPRFEEAELVVTVACAVSVYLLRNSSGPTAGDA
ncbi:AbiJ-NTD4 domain-containing protein [Qipengyuania flava]|uniref:AbiJ-NTD4 domain-containing protein n=1 Tax=Qipengyuania flava TaxID=192812 RepID=UPI001CD6EC30|nr:hypothetical protein [Qipengyuania flava]MCA0891255.1 hypothetical protein [Qipengyuania flava]